MLEAFDMPRSKSTIMAQLSALRTAIDSEQMRDFPNCRKIQDFESRYAEIARELAGLEIQSWRKLQPLAVYF
jgi:hypothetical protein